MEPRQATSGSSGHVTPDPARTPERSSKPASTGNLKRAMDTWLREGRSQGHSPRTLTLRRCQLDQFCWWLEHEAGEPLALASLNAPLIREFLAYSREARPEGRWGSSVPSAQREARPWTANGHYRTLRAFCNFLLAEELLATSPMKNVKAPKVPEDEIIPFTDEQVQAMLDGARRGLCADRDVTLILLLLDSGLRAGAVVGANMEDVDREDGTLLVTEKGNERRRAYMGRGTRHQLWRYIERHRTLARADEPLFVSIGGTKRGQRLTENGLYQIVRDAAKRGGVEAQQVGPHQLRRTMAVNASRNGCDGLHLQKILGHKDLSTTRRYVRLAEADLAQAHRASSPVDRMRLK